MHHLGLTTDSVLRAAAFHGASHQAAQIFQVIVPKQLRPIAIDRQRIQFIYQAPGAFVAVNKAPGRPVENRRRLRQGCGRRAPPARRRSLLRQAAGLNGAAQIVHDLGAKANPRKLARAAVFYENSTARASAISSSTSGTLARRSACVRSL